MTQSVRSAVSAALSPLCKQKKLVLTAIDGRCASGKTTLAVQLQKEFGCSVIHMDHFFLRPHQRTPQRYQEPGGNVDRERFLEEILQPLSRGESVQYRPFLCHSQQMGEPIPISTSGLVIVEGSYSCHPELFPFYDLTVFLTLDPEEQIRRILVREGTEKTEVFRRKWIPLEEYYFSSLQVHKRCHLCLDTSAGMNVDAT